MKPVGFFQRFKAWRQHVAGPFFMLLGSLLAAPGSHAAPQGVISTFYIGALPSDAVYLCKEYTNCTVDGVKEVWYGNDKNWAYKLIGGAFTCNNEMFSDPAITFVKKCYTRDYTLSSLMPPPLTQMPLSFNLYDLLTVSGGRYKVDTVINGVRQILAASGDRILTALPVPSDVRLPQAFFQFNIIDTGAPIQDYAVTLSSTQDRCLVQHRTGTSSVEVSIGRVIEVYAMTARPEAQIIPFRSDTERLCTNDKGQLAIHLMAPGPDAFHMKIVTYGAVGKINDVYEMFLPTSFNWQKM